MKDNVSVIEYKGREYHLHFNLNVMEEIQAEYGSFSEWADLTDGTENNGEPNIKAVVYGITAMINEGIEIDNEEKGESVPLMTLKQVGRMATEIGLQAAIDKLNETVIESTKSTEKNV